MSTNLTEEEKVLLEKARAEQAEKDKFKDDCVTSLTAFADRLYAVTKMGRIYARVSDPRNYNTDGRSTEKFVWRQVDLPF